MKSIRVWSLYPQHRCQDRKTSLSSSQLVFLVGSARIAPEVLWYNHECSYMFSHLHTHMRSTHTHTHTVTVQGEMRNVISVAKVNFVYKTCTDLRPHNVSVPRLKKLLHQKLFPRRGLVMWYTTHLLRSTFAPVPQLTAQNS